MKTIVVFPFCAAYPQKMAKKLISEENGDTANYLILVGRILFMKYSEYNCKINLIWTCDSIIFRVHDITSLCT